MLSLQNFTKNCSDGWGGVIYLFLTSMLEEVLWPVLLLTLWNLVDFLGIIYINQMIEMAQSVWV